MKPVHIVFAPQSRGWTDVLLGRTGRRRWAGLTALVVATSALGAAGWQVLHAQRALAVQQEALRAQGRASSAAKPVVTAAPLSAEERRAWTQAVAQLNTPWPALLSALEAATPDTVALVSVEPDARQASVRLQAEAKTLDDLLAYAQTLPIVEPFGEVALVKHETNDQDPNRPVRLVLNIRLRPQTPQVPTEGGAR